jgi:hypothetical protein
MQGESFDVFELRTMQRLIRENNPEINKTFLIKGLAKAIKKMLEYEVLIRKYKSEENIRINGS